MYSENMSPVPPNPPQVAHDLAWHRTRATEVGSRRLTACAVTWLTTRFGRHYASVHHLLYPQGCCWDDSVGRADSLRVGVVGTLNWHSSTNTIKYVLVDVVLRGGVIKE
jgi:hypothetical protein